MTTGRKILIAAVVILALGTAALLSQRESASSAVEVSVETVERRDLASTVMASGNIRARRTVDISSDVSARVTELLIEEGDDVEAGQVLVRLDPSQLEAARARAEAGLSQAQAQATQSSANLQRARTDFERVQAMYQVDIVSRQELEDAQTTLSVAEANMEASQFGVDQARASLEEAEERLDKTIIRAPMSGRVTRVNIEEGETVIIGTMNNPGSLVLRISDLSSVETVVQVDETEMPLISLGDEANVRIDAFPDRSFKGRITRIGNSAIQPPSQSSATQSAIDFEVVIGLEGSALDLRPDLSATAEIVTDSRKNAVSIPIIALTVRDLDPADAPTGTSGSSPATSSGISGGGSQAAVSDDAESEEPSDIEGVLVVDGRTVTFRPVVVGIAGAEHFEILSGVEVGETIVTGPYQVVRRLRDGDRISPESGSD